MYVNFTYCGYKMPAVTVLKHARNGKEICVTRLCLVHCAFIWTVRSRKSVLPDQSGEVVINPLLCVQGLIYMYQIQSEIN